MKKFLLSALVFIAILSSLSILYSPIKKELLTRQELKELKFSGYELVNPNKIVYPVKKAIEELWSLQNIEPSNIRKYEYSLLEIRFRELIFIINTRKTSFLPESVNRYNGFIGSIKTSYPMVNSDLHERAKEYAKLLCVLRDRYPANSAHWMSIQQAIDVTRNLE